VEDIKEFILPKLPKFDLATDTEYVATLVSANVWL